MLIQPSPVSLTLDDLDRPLTPLSYLSSPVPDLASTLVTQGEDDDAHEENLRFLRIPADLDERANRATASSRNTVSAASATTATATATTQTEDAAGTSSSARRQYLARRWHELHPGQRPNYVGNAQSQIRRDPQINRDRMMRVLARLSRFDQAGRPIGSEDGQTRASASRPREHTSLSGDDDEESTDNDTERGEDEIDQSTSGTRRDSLPELVDESAYPRPDSFGRPNPDLVNRSDRRRSSDNPSRAQRSRDANPDASTSNITSSSLDDVPELHEIVAELRRENPYLAPELVQIMARSRLEREHDAHSTQRRVLERVEQYRRERSAEQPSSSTILRGLQRAEREAQRMRQGYGAFVRQSDEPQAAMRREDHAQSSATDDFANTTERMLRYIRDREHLGGGDEGQSSHNSGLLSRWSRLSDYIAQSDDEPTADTPAPDSPRRAQHGSIWQQSLDRYRREYLSPHPTHRHHAPKFSQPNVAPFLESAIKYLERVREAASYDEALLAAIDTGFGNKEFFADKHDDFLMDVGRCPKPHPSSWLRSGMKFSGSQHTSQHPSAVGPASRMSYQYSYIPISHATASQQHQEQHSSTEPSVQVWNVPEAIQVANGNSSRNRGTTNQPPLEHWPVKVTLHAVDLTAMTLSATMEAYDVPMFSGSGGTPATSSSKRGNAPITTFVEGQIIDLATYSFQTPAGPKGDASSPLSALQSSSSSSSNPSSRRQQRQEQIWTTSTAPSVPEARRTRSYTPQINFPPSTTPALDAAYWRRLPPFDDIADDEEVARVLLSRDRMAAVNERYVFMRWKERCFIHARGDTCPLSPSASQHQQQPHPQQSQQPLSGSRYAAESGFEQPIARFPRPIGNAATEQQQQRTMASSAGATVQAQEQEQEQEEGSATRARLDSAPVPPSGEPGPGPSVVAHISPRRRRRRSDRPVEGGESTTTGGNGTASSTRRGQASAGSEGGNGPAVAAAATGANITVVGEGDDTDTGHGLTISGFYYASLDRATGAIRALYFDPATAPYQCLFLGPVADSSSPAAAPPGALGVGGAGGWSFR